jgi:WhiB family redox-sensing transcriptional regulator
MNLAAILDELGVAPNLPGAHCVGRHDLFDATIEATRTGLPGAADLAAARAEALRLCARCPELAPCGEWFDKQPKSFRPLGVIAGRVVPGRIQASRKSPRKEIA